MRRLTSLMTFATLAGCSISHHAKPTADGPDHPDTPTVDTPPATGFAVVRQFDGDTGPGLAACQSIGGHCDRPEMNVAADGTHVVQITWQHVSIYDYAGHLASAQPLDQLITAAGLTPTSSTVAHPYEPHVVFDEHVQRWVITASCQYDCLLVSATADPTGAWKGIYINNNGNDPGIHLGYDKNGVYLSEFDAAAHDANTASYSYAFFAIPSSEIAWTGTFAPAHLNKSSGTPLDGQPAIDHDTTKAATAPAFFLCKTCTAPNCQNATNEAFDWLVTTVTWSGTTASYSADQLVKTNVGSTASAWLYSTPQPVAQTGSSVTLRAIEDHRVIDAVQLGSHLYGVLGSGPCTANCGAQGSDANNIFIWADLDCTNPSACTVAATAKGADPTRHLVWPSLGVDAAGNAGVVAMASSAGSDLSLVAYRHLASDAPTALSAPLAVTAGAQPYTCISTSPTIGNAVGIATVRDPVDGTKLWTTSEYGASSAACTWATRIVEYQLQ